MGRLAVAAAVLLLSGCAAAKRGGEDIAAVATFPVHVLTTPARGVRERWKEAPVLAVATAPLLVPFYMLGDTFLTTVSAGDAALTPFYTPFQVKPLGVYRLDRFPPTIHPENAREVAEDVLTVPLFLAYCYALSRNDYGYTGDPCFDGGSLFPGSLYPRTRP